MGNGQFRKRNRRHSLIINMLPLQICTCNLELTTEINCDIIINQIITFVNETNYDVFCFHKIKNNRVFSELEQRLKQYYFHPKSSGTDVENISNERILQTSCSKSNDIVTINNDTLFISKYYIISSFKIISVTNSIYGPKYFYCININFNNILISIYSCTLQNDIIGCSNVKLRDKELEFLNGLIYENSKNIISNKYKHIYCNYEIRQIHIICCETNIQHFIGNKQNPEYTKIIQTLNSLDLQMFINVFNDIKNDTIKNTSHILLSHIETRQFAIFKETEVCKNIQEYLYKNKKIFPYNYFISPCSLLEDLNPTICVIYFNRASPQYVNNVPPVIVIDELIEL